jgi:repressor LexA
VTQEYQVETGMRIKEARLALGMTQKDFAASLGIVQGFLSGIETGRKRPSDTLLIALAHTHRIDPQWLKDGGGETFITAPGGERGKKGAPLLDAIPEQFPEGGGVAREYVSLPNLPEGCYAIVCYGDFMAPTVRDGDLIIFRPGSEKKSGDIVLVNNRWGEKILRRYRVKGDDAFLTPDNPAYAPFQPDSNTRTIGVVVEVWRKMVL